MSTFFPYHMLGRLIAVSNEDKKQQHGCLSLGLHNHHDKLFRYNNVSSKIYNATISHVSLSQIAINYYIIL